MNKINYIVDKIVDSRLGRRFIILVCYFFMLAMFLYMSIVKDIFFPAKELCIYTFVDMFAPESVLEFERLHNVKVVFRYFDSNEELLAKFKINKGVGYDVIISSDYMIKYLKEEQLLLQLDREKIAAVYKELDPRLLNKYYDPENLYSLPYSWIPYGVVFNKKIFDQVPETIGLDLLFVNPQLRLNGIKESYKICMVDDPKEAILFAELFLFGGRKSLSKERIAKIQSLLVSQARWVESYANQDVGYPLLSGIIHVALSPLFAVDKVLKASSDFVFMIPREGSIYSIENIAIPSTSKKIELSYKFLNFFLNKRQAGIVANYFGMHPSNKEAYPLLARERTSNKHIFPDDETFSKLHLTPTDTPFSVSEEVWLAVKSS